MRRERAADIELASIDIEAHQPHIPPAIVDGCQRSAESAAHVEHALPVAQVGELDDSVAQPRLRGLEFIRRAGRSERRGRCSVEPYGILMMPPNDTFASHAPPSRSSALVLLSKGVTRKEVKPFQIRNEPCAGRYVYGNRFMATLSLSRPTTAGRRMGRVLPR